MKSRRTIEEVLRRGRRFSAGVLRGVYLPAAPSEAGRREGDDPRAGAAPSEGGAPCEVLFNIRTGSGPGRAVRRNLARRRLREALRKIAPPPGGLILNLALKTSGGPTRRGGKKPPRPIAPAFAEILSSWRALRELCVAPR